MKDAFDFWVCSVQVYPEGTHIVIPWFERPIIYDVQMVTFSCLDPSSPSVDA
jgi:hypothetical protein